MSKRKGAFRSRIDSILAEEEPRPRAKPAAKGKAKAAKKPAARSKPASRPAPAAKAKVAAKPKARTSTTPAARAAASATSAAEEVALSRIKARPGDRAAPTKALSLSVARRGVIQPLVVRPSGRGFEVVDGNQRLAAAKAAGLKTVGVVVRVMSDAEADAFRGVAPAAPSRTPSARPARRRAVEPETFGEEESFEPVTLPLRGEPAGATLAAAGSDRLAAEPAAAGGRTTFQFYFFLLLIAGFAFSVANLLLIKDTTLGVQSGIGVLAGLVLLAVVVLVRRP